MFDVCYSYFILLSLIIPLAISLINGTIGNTMMTDTTSNMICQTTESNVVRNTVSAYLTSTYNAVFTNTIIDDVHGITKTPMITSNDMKNNSNFSRKGQSSLPVLLSSVAGGVLGLLFIVCILFLILKRKYKPGKEDLPNNPLSSHNILFKR